MKRTLSLLLSLCLLIAILPLGDVFAMEGTTHLWINGQEVTEENNTVICGNGTATVVFPEADSDEYLLILDNATITKAGCSYDYYFPAIYIYKNLTIELRGTNTITTPDTDKWTNWGIYCKRLRITDSTGSLTIRCGAASSTSTAIKTALGKVIIYSSGDITAIGGKAPRSYGIEASGGSTQNIHIYGYGKLITYGETAAVNTLIFDNGGYDFYCGNSAPGKLGFKDGSRYQAVVPSLPYKDTDHTQWYYTGIYFCKRNQLMNGVADNRFAPDSPTSRAMLVTILHRLTKLPEHSQSDLFDDVKAGSWYADAVLWAAENEIVNGVGDRRFDPDGNITREQMAAILYRYCNAMGMDTSKRAALSSFSDYAQVSDWAQEAMEWAVAEGLLNGSDGKLMPQGNATRAQVATILMRFVQNNAQAEED